MRPPAQQPRSSGWFARTPAPTPAAAGDDGSESEEDVDDVAEPPPLPSSKKQQLQAPPRMTDTGEEDEEDWDGEAPWEEDEEEEEEEEHDSSAVETLAMRRATAPTRTSLMHSRVASTVAMTQRCASLLLPLPVRGACDRGGWRQLRLWCLCSSGAARSLKEQR